MREGRAERGCGEAHCGATKERNTPQHGAMHGGRSFLAPAYGSKILVWRVDRSGASEPSPATQKNRGSGGLRLRLTALPAAGAADARCPTQRREQPRGPHGLRGTSARGDAPGPSDRGPNYGERTTARLVRVPPFDSGDSRTRHPQARDVTGAVVCSCARVAVRLHRQAYDHRQRPLWEAWGFGRVVKNLKSSF